MSQATLAQVHKYEAGKNRVPAGRMHLVAKALDVNVAYSYGLDDAGAGVGAEALADCIALMTERSAVELLTCFRAIAPPQRSVFLELGKLLAAANGTQRSISTEPVPPKSYAIS